MADETVSSASFLNGRDTISTKDAKVYATINGQIIPLIECNEFSAKLKKTKKKYQHLAVIGFTRKSHLLKVRGH